MAFLARHRVVANIGALLSGTAGARVLSAVSIIIIARQVGPTEYGQYAAGIALATLSSVLFSLGLDAWLLRSGSRDDNLDTLARHSTAVFLLKGGAGLVWLLGMMITVPFLNPTLYPLPIVTASVLTIFFEELVNTAWSSFKTALRNEVTFILMLLLQVIILSTTLVLAWLDVETVLPYLYGRAASAGFVSVLVLIWMNRTIGFHFDSRFVRKAVRQTLPYGVSVGLALLYGRADILIIGHWLGQEAVGLYSPAVALMMAAVMIPSSIFGVMLPILSQEHEKNAANVWSMSVRLLLGSTILGLLASAAIAILAHPLVLFMYGEAYTVSADVLQIMSGILVFRFMSFGIAASVVAVGWQGKRVLVQAFVAVFNVGLNILIVQQWGILGVAKIYVLTEGMLAMGYLGLLLGWRFQSRREDWAMAGTD